jgi:hypothetical protein
MNESVEVGEQAEAAHLSGNAGTSNKGRRFHGSGYADLPGEGAFTWYAENDGKAANFDLIFRYAGEDREGGRAMRLEVNGKVVVTETLLKNTGGWGTHWKTWTTRQRLQQGANEIRFSTLGHGGMNIDEMLIKPVRLTSKSQTRIDKP